MAPPCGDAAAAGSAAPGLANLLIREGASLPPLPERSGNVAEREEGGAQRKKAGAQRITGWGLREYSKIVSKKVEAKGRTTYNEVADEIFAELNSITHNGPEFDEKNIRRRVHDAFNVLIAIHFIVKDKKEIKWMGLSNYRYEKIQKLEEVQKELVTRIKNKKKLLQEIEKQFDDIKNIKLRNQALQRPAEIANGIRLPFLLIKTSRKSRVEIEISEDSKFARFDSNGAPFIVHDDVSILEGIRRNSIGRAGLAPSPFTLSGT